MFKWRNIDINQVKYEGDFMINKILVRLKSQDLALILILLNFLIALSVRRIIDIPVIDGYLATIIQIFTSYKLIKYWIILKVKD